MCARICFHSVPCYEMATGTLPFRGESMAVICEAILNREPVPAVRLNPDVSVEFERVISKAMEKDRNLRYQHAADLRTDLQRLTRDSSRMAPAAAKLPRNASWIALPCHRTVAGLLPGRQA